jgi:hypothetical protein
MGTKHAAGLLNIKPFTGDLAALEKSLPTAGPHAMVVSSPDAAAQSTPGIPNVFSAASAASAVAGAGV